MLAPGFERKRYADRQPHANAHHDVVGERPDDDSDRQPGAYPK
ncbi:hypothetical protein [Stutzerimonas azotifigens]|nr:hypothetical protein [Stutzerimonas azotifigens]